ncbi:MAG: mechanosensitive ion channel [Candidatus Melainabacteria bacterium]|nr:mechanosensitive ion channel [Candidatus Melainabacteria bacterium]
MDIHNLFEQSVSFVVYLATSSEYAVSFWATMLCLILLLNKKAVVEYIWRSLHLIEDLVLQKEYFAKIDKALKILLVTLACSPFFHFLPSIANKALSAFALDLVFFGWYLTKYKDANVPSVMRAFVIGGIYVVFGLIFLEWSLGVNVLPLLATSTVVTAVLGLAMQDTLKNLFAGLTMGFEKRYRQGDWVNFRLDANNNTVGQVSEIGWRTTRLRTLDNNFAVIPNSMFTTYQVVNYSLPTPSYARTIEFPIRATADVESVLTSLTKNAPTIEGVLKEPAPESLLLSVKPDHIVVRLRFYIEDFSKGDTLSGRVMEVCLADLAKMRAVPAVSAVPAGKE